MKIQLEKEANLETSEITVPLPFILQFVTHVHKKIPAYSGKIELKFVR